MELLCKDETNCYFCDGYCSASESCLTFNKPKTSREPSWISGYNNDALRTPDILRTRLQCRMANTDTCWHRETQCAKQMGGKDTLIAVRQEPQVDAAAVVAMLMACAKEQHLHKGYRIHAHIRKHVFLRTNIYVGNVLVNMYVKCGALAKAQSTLDELQVRNVVTWNTLIAGYAEHGHGHEALRCFDQMQRDGTSPNIVTYICIMKACGIIGAVKRGQQLHVEIIKQGLLVQSVSVGIGLVDMYAKFGMLLRSVEMFEELPVQDVVSWTALIAGYAQHGHGCDTFNLFEQMCRKGISPNAATFTCIIKTCGSLEAAEKADHIYAEVARHGLLRTSKIVGNALVDMYIKCELLPKAQKVFDELPHHDVVTWSSLIAGYAQHEHGHEALNCFKWMQQEGIFPNIVTYTAILKACSTIGAEEKGEEIHAKVVEEGLLERSTILGTSLVDMYAKCGSLAKAQKVFDGICVHDAVSWNALLAGYAEHGYAQEVFSCYEHMQQEGHSPSFVTYTCIFKACGSFGAVQKGGEIHEAVRQGQVKQEFVLTNALVDMYVKCGALSKAQEVFDQLTVRNLFSWSALMMGYGQLGEIQVVFRLFVKMLIDIVEPSLITFIVLLNACSHAGLVDEAQLCFNTMDGCYDIIPSSDHNVCMVDLFGRAGNFERALEFIKKMPFSDSSLCHALWCALLGGCRKWGNVKIGRLAFQNLTKLDDKDAAAYSCMSNIFVNISM